MRQGTGCISPAVKEETEVFKVAELKSSANDNLNSRPDDSETSTQSAQNIDMSQKPNQQQQEMHGGETNQSESLETDRRHSVFSATDDTDSEDFCVKQTPTINNIKPILRLENLSSMGSNPLLYPDLPGLQTAEENSLKIRDSTSLPQIPAEICAQEAEVAPPPRRKKTVSILDINEVGGSSSNYDHCGSIMGSECGGNSTNRSQTASTIFMDETSGRFLDDTCFARSNPHRPGRIRALSERELAMAKGHGRNFKRIMKNGTIRWLLTNFPRTLAILIGIIIPLWMLNFFSLMFGVLLAHVELPGEITSNDEELVREATAVVTSHTISNITAAVPGICAALYLQKQDLSTLDMHTVVFDALSRTPEEVAQAQAMLFNGAGMPATPEAGTNWTEWYFYMLDCGSAVKSYAENVVAMASAAERATAGVELTFNWIRCHEGATGKFDAFLSDKFPIDELTIQAQSATYRKSWEADQQRLYNVYYNVYIEQGVPSSDAHTRAFDESVAEATGGNVCTLNGPGAAFFWFTVMTTIGYGNQAPDSTGGRALLYTLGFVSILAFGSILATAGTISSAVFDDIATREGLLVLTKPWCGCVIWASFYYGWMAFIGWAVVTWKHNRVEADFSYRDGYWFAYLSTTTVGLGDVYLEPEVILGSDLLYMPIMMLTGFVFLAAFLGKFREMVTNIMKQKRATFVESLLIQMRADDHHEDESQQTTTTRSGRMFILTPETSPQPKLDEVTRGQPIAD